MKTKRLLALLMAVATMVTLFAACGDKGEEKKDETTTSSTSISYKQPAADENSANIGFDKGLTATKVGSFKKGKNTSFWADYSGAKYEMNGKYGIVSADGKYDSGAVYTFCQHLGSYFIVSKTEPESVTDIVGSNCFGIVDVKGNEIIPFEYNTFNIVDASTEKFVRAYKITDKTENEDEALLYAKDSVYQFGYQEGNTLYKGSWCVYSFETGKKVPGAEGTKACSVSASQNILTYQTDAGTKMVVGPEGNAVPSDAEVFANGCYCIKAGDGQATVYDAYGTKLFDYTSANYFYFYPCTDDLFRIKDGDKSFIVDKTGQRVSAEFDSSFTSVADGLLISDGCVYDFAGNIVLDGDYYTLEKDDITGNVWYVSGNDGEALIKKDGTVLYSCKKNDGVYFLSIYFLAEKEGEGKYYSFADEDFTIKGSSFDKWIVKAKSEDGLEGWLVDTISGKKLVEGYSEYYCMEVDGTLYIHASNYADDTVDIFKVS